MKKNIYILVIAIIFFNTGYAQTDKHVVLISIDGFRPEFYKDEKWATPVLKRLAAEGISADGVRGVFPSVTYPSHTTILTGVMPAKHGIYYNSPFEPLGQTGRWYWESNLIKRESLWDAAKKSGLKTASVFWPVSLGAPVDYNIPEIWPLDKAVNRLKPIRENSKPAGLFEEIEVNATGKLNESDLNSDFLSADENGARMVSYIFKTYKPNLLTFHIYSVDHASHAQGREGHLVELAVAGADQAVGNILEAIEQAGLTEKTTVIITGDHGFANINTSVSPNVMLLKNKIISDTLSNSKWDAKFHTSGASAFLHLNKKGDIKTLNKVRSMLKDLPEDQRKHFRVLERKELDQIGADPEAQLALAPVEGVTMSSSVKGDVIKPAKGGTHGFYPDFKNIHTGFIGFGPEFNKGRRISLMGLEDIAPVISKLLNLQMSVQLNNQLESTAFKKKAY